MIITYQGHSQFTLESARGFSVVTDPYDAHVGYEMQPCKADAVTVSHGHGDHSFIQKALGEPAVIREPGLWMLTPEVRVTAIPSWHDDREGELRGNNLLCLIEIDGLRILHMGDFGQDDLTDEQQKAVGQVDILMLPVGGYYTIDAATARRMVYALHPRIVIPMHYKTEKTPGFPIAPVQDFLSRMQANGAPTLPLLRVTREDLSEQPALAVLDY